MAKKFIDVLNKQIKRSFKANDYEKKLAQDNLKEWEKQGQKAELKTELDYIMMSTVFQSIVNKMQIENAYLLVKDSLVEFWGTLDYQERKRIVNIDMNKTYEELPHFMSLKDGKNVYITFLDSRMNEIYTEETVMFELKQYHSLFLNYKEFIQPFSVYDYDCFNGKFVPTICLCKENDTIILYNNTLAKFYVIKDKVVSSYPLFDKDTPWKTMTMELLMPLAELLKDGNETEFFTMAKAFGLYSEDFYRSVNRILAKKGLFF
ncbi:MAG: hypothetical protein IKM20_07275 [Erysipelotrichales bacterium]|nr:hypothetical protein [Erysipelotrichales bacterium]